MHTLFAFRPRAFVAPRLARLARCLPAAVAAASLLLPACTPDPTGDELRSEEHFQSNRFLKLISKSDEPPVEEAPEDLFNSDDEAGGVGQRHKGEEGKMGKPTSKYKSGLYAMRGPKDAVSRNGGPVDVEAIIGRRAPQSDAEVWGGLSGTEVGEAYGVGGLGLVGTGRGGGGTAETWTGDTYEKVAPNPWQLVNVAPLSTFSIDVDTASYANVRRFLTEGSLPPNDAVRVEEMVNYFDYGYEEISGEHPLDVAAEVAPCPWAQDHRLVRVGLQAKRIKHDKTPRRNLVFLVDTSGSMSSEDKLPLVQKALTMLVDDLRAEDRISLVTYAGDTRVVLQSTPGDQKLAIKQAIHDLSSGGGTHGSAGIVLAYKEAHKSFLKGGINRVLLATDGDFNVGLTGRDAMIALIEKERDTGVHLSVVGVGRGNLNDAMMEQVADHGDGNYAYIDSEKEAKKVLVTEVSGTLVTVAKDVKVQLEFNPGKIAGYRLVGYENRALTAQEFNDDAKDAGELGAGDSVTALYEVVPTGKPVPGAVLDSLKYQRATDDSELLTVKIRYKRPEGGASTKFERPLADRKVGWDNASPQTRLAAAVAAFGLKLRDPSALPSVSLPEIKKWVDQVDIRDPEGEIKELGRLIDRAHQLGGRGVVHSDGR